MPESKTNHTPDSYKDAKNYVAQTRWHPLRRVLVVQKNITDTGTIKRHIDDFVLQAGLAGFIDKSELKKPATGFATKSLML